MSADEGDEPVDGERPEDSALADAVDEAMKPEIKRVFVEAYQRQIMEKDRVRPPRHREDVDDILDKLRDEGRGDDPGGAGGRAADGG